MKTYILPVGLITLIVFLFSCVKKFDNIEANYQGALAFSIASVNFEIGEVLNEDSILTIDDENAISLIIREDDLYYLDFEELTQEFVSELKAETYTEASVGIIQLENYQRSTMIAFEDFVEQFDDPALVAFFQNNDGASAPIPAFTELVNTSVQLDPIVEFNYLVVDSGRIAVTIQNDYFVDLEDFTIAVHDDIAGMDIGTLNFTFIGVGETVTEEFLLTNTTINNQFSFAIPSIATSGSTTPVMIDLASLLTIALDVVDLSVRGGEIELPAVDLESDTLDINFDASNGVELTQIAIEEMEVKYAIKSEFGAEVKVVVRFPHVLKNNNPFEHIINVSPTGLNDSITGIFDFSGATIMLDQNSLQPYNILQANYQISLSEPPNQLVEFSSEDKFSLYFSMDNLQLSEVFGYFGQYLESIPAGDLDLGFNFELFESTSTPAYFEKPEIRLLIENSFGVPLVADLNMVAEGLNGATASLNGPSLEIGYPSVSEIGTVVNSNFQINDTNSELVELLSVYPLQLFYDGSVEVNLLGNNGETNFATKDSYLNLSAEFDLPFNFRVKDLIYRDTAEAFSIDLEEGLTIENIREAELKIASENGLPFLTTLNIFTINAAGDLVKVIEGVQIPPAKVNAQGQVEMDEIVKEEIFVMLSSEQIRQLDEAVENVFEIHLQTIDEGNQPVALYTDYGITLGLGLKVFLDF